MDKTNHLLQFSSFLGIAFTLLIYVQHYRVIYDVINSRWYFQIQS